MKEIKFIDLSLSGKKGFVYWLYMFCIILCLIEFVSCIVFRDFSSMFRYVTIGIIAYFITPLFFQNYVEWDKSNIRIKLNTKIQTKWFRFINIKLVDFQENTLEITNANDKVTKFDLINISPQSIEQLKDVFRKRYVKIQENIIS